MMTDFQPQRWDLGVKRSIVMCNFMLEEFGRSMQTLGYIDPGLKEAIMIRSDDKNLPLYRLTLYSKHRLGSKFWKETKKYSDPQTGFEFK